jgi:hypothetical protein
VFLVRAHFEVIGSSIDQKFPTGYPVIQSLAAFRSWFIGNHTVGKPRNLDQELKIPGFLSTFSQLVLYNTLCLKSAMYFSWIFRKNRAGLPTVTEAKKILHSAWFFW